MTPTIKPTYDFTPEQERAYNSLVPDVPEEVVAQILREWRCFHLREDLSQEAYLGTAQGVLSFDGTKGSSLRQWVFFSALHAALALVRKDRRFGRLLQRESDAMMLYAKHSHATFPVMGDTDEAYRARLNEFRAGAAAAVYVGLAVLDVPTGGEDEIIERETAARCKAGLAKAVGELSERRREVLRLCFADDQSVKDVAATSGEKGYRAELVEFHRTVDLVGARLSGMGFHERPPFPPEADTTILRPTSARVRTEP